MKEPISVRSAMSYFAAAGVCYSKSRSPISVMWNCPHELTERGLPREQVLESIRSLLLNRGSDCWMTQLVSEYLSIADDYTMKRRMVLNVTSIPLPM